MYANLEKYRVKIKPNMQECSDIRRDVPCAECMDPIAREAHRKKEDNKKQYLDVCWHRCKTQRWKALANRELRFYEG